MEIKTEIIDLHIQIYPNSCIPSAVEMVLKLLQKVKTDYYALQKCWNNRDNGSFRDISEETIEGVTFKLVNGLDSEKLFERIDKELKEGRYAIISLWHFPNIYHMFVIYYYDEKKMDYKAFTKNSQSTEYIENVRDRVKVMGTTDILVYSVK